VAKGFSCIKIKVGGLDFEVECDMLREIRHKYDRDTITLRLDANGAFDDNNALSRLEALSAFSVHSIEQPVKPGSKQLAEICRRSPVPIALDEELIGNEVSKRQLLETVRPSFIVLMPSLHGGIYHCRDWINVAGHLGIGWWITSALESSIGLNAISQFTGEYAPEIPQGLGTGSIYTDNIQSPLRVLNGSLQYDPQGKWEPDLQV
ncbi:MAG TPA: enolase C-terminal domain-like protein, partial [Cyclobacteriaceae bacterium]|nr:enolase C-terminal domain-like protein [Cyclobacteriaceae bacterium]